MPNTIVTPAGWSWDVVLYFFIGGVTGGAFFIASLLRLVGGRSDWSVSRIGYYLAFPLVNVCAILLTKDLGRPGRFWHMLLESQQLPHLAFKWWSPISFGAWILFLFGILALFSFVHALLEGGVIRSDGLYRFTSAFHNGAGALSVLYLVIAMLWGLALGGYTGILLSNTNAPTWAHDLFLAPMFMTSSVSTGAAAMFVVSALGAVGPITARARVVRTAFMALVLEALLLLAAVILGALPGHVAPYYLGWWAVLFWVVVLPLGFALPLVLLFTALYRNRSLVRNAVLVGAVVLLAGGFLLRLVEVIGGQAYYQPYPGPLTPADKTPST